MDIHLIEETLSVLERYKPWTMRLPGFLGRHLLGSETGGLKFFLEKLTSSWASRSDQMHSNKTQTILSTFPADKPITSPLGICFFPLALKSVALFANVYLKIYDKTKTFSGKCCKKKKEMPWAKESWDLHPPEKLEIIRMTY